MNKEKKLEKQIALEVRKSRISAHLDSCAAAAIIGYLLIPGFQSAVIYIQYQEKRKGNYSSSGGCNIFNVKDRPSALALLAVRLVSYGAHLQEDVRNIDFFSSNNNPLRIAYEIVNELSADKLFAELAEMKVDLSGFTYPLSAEDLRKVMFRHVKRIINDHAGLLNECCNYWKKKAGGDFCKKKFSLEATITREMIESWHLSSMLSNN